MSDWQILPCDNPLIRGTPHLRCRASRLALVGALGEPHYPNQEGFGLGNYNLWAYAFPCGCKVMITFLPSHTEHGGRNADDEPSHVWINTTDSGLLKQRPRLVATCAVLPVARGEVPLARSSPPGS
jgi:hypothetical protein